MYVDVTEHVAWSVCRSVMLVSLAKMAELIELPFGLRSDVAQSREPCIRAQILPWEWAILRGAGVAHCKV